MKFTKPALAAILVALMAVPWQRGGKQPAALLVSLVLALVALYLLWTTLPEGTRPTLASKLWLGLLGWGAFSLVWSVNRYQTILWLFVVGLSFMGYYFGVWASRHSQAKRWWLSAYFGLGTVVASWGIFIYIADPYERITGSFYLANPLAAFLLPILLLACWQLLQLKNKFLWAVVPVVGAAWVLADSRTSFILAILAGLSLSFVRLKPRMWMRFGLAFVLIAAMVGAVSLSRHFVQRHVPLQAPGARLNELSSGSTSGSDRINYLRSSLEMLKYRPILGGGAGTFATLHPKYQNRVISASSHPHNFYAAVAGELGLPGFALSLAWAGALLWSAWICWRTKTNRAFAVVLVVMVLHLALDIDSIYPAIMVPLGVIAGLVTAGGRAKAARWKLEYAALAVGLMLLLPAVSAYISDRSAQFGAADQDGGDYQTAAADFAASHHGLVYDPDNLTSEGIAHYTLASTNKGVAANELNQALQLAMQAQKLDPLDPQHQFLEARVLLKQGKLDAAEAAYKRAIKLDPYNHPEYYVDLTNLYFQSKRYKEAQTIAEASLEQFPPKVVENRQFIPGLRQQISLLYFLHAASMANQNQPVTDIKKELFQAIKLDPANSYATDFLTHLPQQ